MANGSSWERPIYGIIGCGWALFIALTAMTASQTGACPCLYLWTMGLSGASAAFGAISIPGLAKGKGVILASLATSSLVIAAILAMVVKFQTIT